ncbi:MAG: bifunctional 4-hydroxy-3-methylbut-2-enyl diphosphate reductase/30S ribosomal protein S1 [Eubacteriales bacterium]|jgi:(E)-4-hydroxy-3-methyl-but-2-enyl pyrophosphate reductase
MRNYKLAKSAGFCFGVRRAVDMVWEQLDKTDKKLYMLGPIVHNMPLIHRMEQKGAILIEDIEEIPSVHDARVLIRAHGLPLHEYERLNEAKLEYADGTCPFVRKIHDIVRKRSQLGDQVIIIGDAAHPEVVGINGWCNNSAIVAKNSTELTEHLKQYDNLAQNPVCVVAQTTINRENFEKCVDILKKQCTNAQIFDTICNATNERQQEAARIAQDADAMIVIGSFESSNTRKLVEVCKKFCDRVYHIETASELDPAIVSQNDRIGLTAGASTPAFIIKEVVDTMVEKNFMDEDISFAEAFEQSLKTINNGDIVTGTVVAIAPNEIHLDLGTKSDGYIPVSELSDDANADVNSLVKVGDEIEAFVVRVNDVEGTIMLSKKKVDSIKGFNKIKEAYENGDILSGKVVDAIKGGIIVMVDGTRVFVPASLAAERYTADLSTLVGNDVQLKVIEVNPARRRVTGSIKVVLDEIRKQKSEALWETIEEGKHYTGVVKSLTSYGAFVDIGGVDGMIHISELSWSRVKHPSEVLSVGQEVDVYILKADKETHKISLGYKKDEDNPWNIFTANYKVGDVVKCKIVKLMNFGAFAEIIPGIDGLIHISQIANKHIAKPDDVLTVGEEVEAKLVEIDNDTKKINLSIRALLDQNQDAE